MENSPLKDVESFLERIYHPVTEEDCLCALRFYITFVLHIVTLQYRTGWFGETKSGVKIDFETVKDQLAPKLMEPIVSLVEQICSDFDVVHPAEMENGIGMSFREWYEKVQQKLGMDDEYPGFIFERI